MEFCKTVKEFDCAKFEEGKLYYIHWHDIRNNTIKAIYLCDIVDRESNSISVKMIFSLQGLCPARTIRFEPRDVNCINEVQEVEFKAGYNESWKEWYIKGSVAPELMVRDI